jgi:hypothetical protein
MFVKWASPPMLDSLIYAGLSALIRTTCYIPLRSLFPALCSLESGTSRPKLVPYQTP